MISNNFFGKNNIFVVAEIGNNHEGNYKNAIKLRRFDEGAKKQNIKIKKIEDYKELLISKII